MSNLSRPKLPFKVPVKDIGSALSRLEALLRDEKHSSHLFTWQALLFQIADLANPEENLKRAAKALNKAVSINPNDMEALVEGLYFFSIVLPNRQKARTYAKRIKRLLKEADRAVADFEGAEVA